MSTSAPPQQTDKPWGLRSLGPAIIVASATLGPGCVLTASRNGYDYGYQTVWVLALAGLLLFAMTALSARLGIGLSGTLCDELAAGLGRPAAALVGLSLFLINACFQFGVNLGAVAALEPFYDAGSSWGKVVPVAIIVNMNVVVIAALFGFQAFYQPVEKVMKFLISLMVIGFAINIFFARPDWAALIDGLVPRIPELRNGDVSAGLAQRLQPMISMFASTCAIGAAFYQSYLVRQKGWTLADTRKGLIDSAVGIAIVVLVTVMIVATAASMLNVQHGAQFATVADIARQLEPAFGAQAKVLFSLGIFAAACGAFLMNAMIGGAVLADGLGLGGSMDGLPTKICTVLALAVGMNVALYIVVTGQKPVHWIVAIQAFTVLAGPILAGAMVYLAFRQTSVPGLVTWWMKLLAICTLVLQVVLAVQTGYILSHGMNAETVDDAMPAAAAATQ